MHPKTLESIWWLRSDGFWLHNMITLSTSSLQLFTIAIVHAEQYSTRFMSPLALGYKQNEYENILCEMLRQSKELENITYWKKFGVVSSTLHCQVIQNDHPERYSNTCTLQHGLYSKVWGFSCLFNNKIPSCNFCLKKRLSKVTPHLWWLVDGFIKQTLLVSKT